MRKYLLALVALLSLLSPAKAADSTLALLTAAGAVSGADLLYCTQAGADRKCTATQMATYINSLFSGDMTVTSGGVATLKNTGPGATGPLGSATVAPIITIDAQGRVTALSSATVTPALGSITGFGAGVATQLAAAVSTAGGSTQTVAAGTAVLGTSAITSGSCATVVTSAATNTATTDTISFTPNADITAVTGYAPVTTGGLAIYPYPTANNVNFKVCNPTSSSITPGAVTLNWRVTR